MTQEEQGQTPVTVSDIMQSVTGTSSDMDTSIGDASGGDMEKARQKADSVRSIENRKFY